MRVFSSFNDCEHYIERINSAPPKGPQHKNFKATKNEILKVTQAVEDEFDVAVNAEYLWGVQSAAQLAVDLLRKHHKRTDLTNEEHSEIGRAAAKGFLTLPLLLAASLYNLACENVAASNASNSEKDMVMRVAVRYTTLDFLFSSILELSRQRTILETQRNLTAPSKIMADLGRRSGKKFTEAKQAISEIAKERWDEGENISIGAIAEDLMRFIEADPQKLGLDEPPRLSTIVNWLRPIAPGYARKPGRPKKG